MVRINYFFFLTTKTGKCYRNPRKLVELPVCLLGFIYFYLKVLVYVGCRLARCRKAESSLILPISPPSQLLASVLCQEVVVCTHSRAVVLAPCLGLCHLLSALIWQLAGGIGEAEVERQVLEASVDLLVETSRLMCAPLAWVPATRCKVDVEITAHPSPTLPK